MSNPSIPEERTYRHDKCGEETTVGGQPFEVMSNPLSDMARTWCSKCEGFAPLSEFAWADTDEKILDYYARHSQNATDMQRFLCSRKCMLILGITGLIVGAVGGFVLFSGQSTGVKLLMTVFCAGIGGFVGLAFYISVLCNSITKRVCGVKDTRQLK